MSLTLLHSVGVLNSDIKLRREEFDRTLMSTWEGYFRAEF
jgi:hypothetical protein